MGTKSNVGRIRAQDVAGPGVRPAGVPAAVPPAGEPRESMLGEWIGVSLDRFLHVTGRRPERGDDRGGVTVLAAEVQPRRRVPLDGDDPGSRGRDRAGVTIVRWRVYADEVARLSDTGARIVR